mgnify:CR=1 FL=1
MGHKVHPYGFRLGVSRTWTAKWYADNKEYTASLQEDIKIREHADSGKPSVVADPDGRVAEIYRQIARRVRRSHSAAGVEFRRKTAGCG